MASSGLQTGGFVLGLVGAAATIGATVMDNWSTKDRQGDVVTSVYTYKGLWRDCEITTSGFTECRPLYGLLGYSGRGLKLYQETKVKQIVDWDGFRAQCGSHSLILDD